MLCRLFTKASELVACFGGVVLEEGLKGGLGISSVAHFKNLAYSGWFFCIAYPSFKQKSKFGRTLESRWGWVLYYGR